jgi:hypothetical protein
LGENARKLIAREHDNNKLMQKLTAFYAELLKKK